jgi:hypothetical protein
VLLIAALTAHQAALVISNEVRNLVLNPTVTMFSWDSLAVGKVELGCWGTRFLTSFEMTREGLCTPQGRVENGQLILRCAQRVSNKGVEVGKEEGRTSA